MKKKFLLVLMGVLFLSFSLVSGVRAEESSLLESTDDRVEQVEVVVPDPESRWFGISWAFEKVRHNFEVWMARSEEKKAELELKFTEKEEKLVERIAELEEVNPELADKLEKVVSRLEDDQVKRLERLEERIGKMGEKGTDMEQRMSRWQEKVEERRKVIERRMEERRVGGDREEGEEGVLERVRERIRPLRGDEDEGGEVREDGGEIEMRGKGVRIQDARPGVVRMR